MIDSTSAANAMDRLSDWVGACVPGCARMPTRHPVKVSLVMGALGLLAGWLTVSPVVVLEAFNRFDLQWLFNLLPGTMLGIVVFLPLLAWQQRSAGVMFAGVLLAFGAGALHIMLLDQFGQTISGQSTEGFIFAGTFAGVIYAVAGIIVNTRREWWMLLPVMAVSGLMHGALIATSAAVESHMLNLPFGLHMVVFLSFSANLFAGVYVALGITLGSALWDRAPQPKFEASDAPS